MESIENIVIVGAGAMGCLFAGRLIEGGLRVTLVDIDATRMAMLNADGLTFRDDGGERTIPVRSCIAADVSGPVDLIIMFTKGMHTDDAVASIAHLASGRTRILTLQNGLGNAEAIARVFAPDRILIGATDVPADLSAPTLVISHGTGRILMGALESAGMSGVQPAADALRRGGFDARADVDVRVAIWEKVAFNATMNGLATITGLTVGNLDAPPGHRIAAAVIAETSAVAAAHGIAVSTSEIHAKVTHALANHRGHKPSMLQDRLAGRRTEVESINGAIVRFGEAAGIATPVIATLADLVRLGEPTTDAADPITLEQSALH